MVLERYADAIIDFATHPVTGIQRVSKWPPSIAEVVSHCDTEVARLDKIKHYREMTPLPQLPRPLLPPGEDFDAMVAKHGRPLGPNERGTVYENYAGRQVVMGRKAGEFKKFTVEDLQRLYARHDEAVL
jgi:hypothetical protein